MPVILREIARMKATQFLDFEKPIIELEDKITELNRAAAVQNVPVDEEVKRLTEKARKLRSDIYSKLTAWQYVQLARHPLRPYTIDYIKEISDDFVELSGDRAFADDPSIIGGLISIEDKRCMIIGHQKGRNTKENIHRNFGMPHPEGYRKALRLMKLAEKFRRPIVTLIDTPGAYPGIDAEKRGQAEAIARNLREMAALKVPTVSVVIGEGGSGGALALGVSDRILMLEYSIYSVISPEGCAAILWKDPAKNRDAAEALRLTPQTPSLPWGYRPNHQGAGGRCTPGSVGNGRRTQTRHLRRTELSRTGRRGSAGRIPPREVHEHRFLHGRFALTEWMWKS